MKIFDRDGKLNIVDENNVLVGFYYTLSCCEQFGYLITKELPTQDDIKERLSHGWEEPTDNVDDYVFDTNFFHQDSFEYECATATFRVVSQYLPPLYITLFNSHNGYYSHGFSMDVKGVKLHDGYI